MNAPRPTAIIVVDVAGRNGECSNCKQPAALDDAHACGARVTGVAINTEYAPDPTFAMAHRVSDVTPAGVEFVGVGRIVKAHDGWRFELTKAPGDLA